MASQPRNLSGSQIDRISKAITQAHTCDDLRRALMVGMQVNFDALAPEKGFEQQVFVLVEWAVRQGRAEEPARCVYDANPGNAALAAIYCELAVANPSLTPLYIEWVTSPAGEFLIGSDKARDLLAEAD